MARSAYPRRAWVVPTCEYTNPLFPVDKGDYGSRERVVHRQEATATQLTLGVAIWSTGVVDESGVVPGIHGVDTDLVVKRVCVLSSRVIPEESSGERQGTGSTDIEICGPLLSVKINRCWENQLSGVFLVYGRSVSFQNSRVDGKGYR